MNRVFSFFAAMLLVFTIELFHWEVPPGPSQDLSDNSTANAVAAPNNHILGFNFGFGFDPDFHFINNGATSSKPAAPALDPVTMLLFGSGLVGLAGLGRKKIKK